MQINEVCRICKITKKAVEYYEKKGLIHPQIAQNGYRTYNENDISTLKEISVLRKLGLTANDIKSILLSNDKAATLANCKFLLDLKLQKAIVQHNTIDQLIQNYDIAQALESLQIHVEPQFTIKEKLLFSFPGSYGMYLVVHFGPFLNEKIDSVEKELVYQKIINFLDDLHFPAELEASLEEYFPIRETETMQKMDDAIISSIDNLEEYLETNKGEIEEYLKIRTSDEFKASPVYKFQQMLKLFQQQSGYYDIFIKNLIILSPSYQAYTQKLETANSLFVEEFPQAGKLYD